MSLLTPLRTIAGIGLAFFAGMAIGNYHATQRAVAAATTAALDHGAREQAAVTAALEDYRKKELDRIAKDAKKERDADRIAHDAFEEGVKSAGDAAAIARAQLARDRAALAKERETNDGLRAVNTMLARDGASRADADRFAVLCGSADTRRVLDNAAGAGDRPGGDNSPGGAAPADAAGGAAPPPAAGAEAAGGPSRGELTCDQLTDGYINLGEWGREGWSGFEAWQRWFAERFGAPES